MTIDKQKVSGIKAAALVGVGANPEDTLALLAEIERLDRESQNLSNQVGKGDRERRAFRAERDQLKAENKALRKDAERYRWLRDKQTFIWLMQDWFPGEAMLTNVDADIDAAMAKEESHG